MNKAVTMIGSSAATLSVLREIQQAARSDAKVLITGESGVGKEVVARLIHQQSARAAAPLITINCAGLPDGLLESELFGHVKGSFTDARRNKPGLFEAAQHGTIFLDEIGEMSVRMQALLLRFLETGEIQRVGSERPLPPLDVRVITATHRPLPERIADNTFREDLFYRLNVINIVVPPLRERREDVPDLARHFLALSSAAIRTPIPELAPDAMQCLVDHDWPGNVRELRNIAERLVLRATNGHIGLDAVPREVLGRSRASGARANRDTVNGTAHTLFARLLERRGSFWTEVYDPFMARDLTREQVREVVRLGLGHTKGSYKMLVRSFNMPPQDYKRFLKFLQAYDCHVRFQQFRPGATEPSPERVFGSAAVRQSLAGMPTSPMFSHPYLSLPGMGRSPAHNSDHDD